jgi:hypothetical protein
VASREPAAGLALLFIPDKSMRHEPRSQIRMRASSQPENPAMELRDEYSGGPPHERRGYTLRNGIAFAK